MTNKENFLLLVSPANSETMEGIRFREENKAWLHESRRIAIKVLKALKNQGITQKDLANQMGVTPQYVNKLVKGKENFTLDTLIKLQNILNIPLLASYHEESKHTPLVQLINYKVPYQQVEFCNYNSSEKKVIGYE